MIRHLLFMVLLFVSTGYAFLAGGKWERWVASLLCGATLATIVLMAPATWRYVSFEAGTMAVDVALFAGLMAVSMVTDRYWPLWITALHGVALLTHAAVAYTPAMVPPEVYADAAQLLAYPMQLLLVVATFRYRRKLRALSTGRSWPTS